MRTAGCRVDSGITDAKGEAACGSSGVLVMSPSDAASLVHPETTTLKVPMAAQRVRKFITISRSSSSIPTLQEHMTEEGAWLGEVKRLLTRVMHPGFGTNRRPANRCPSLSLVVIGLGNDNA